MTDQTQQPEAANETAGQDLADSTSDASLQRSVMRSERIAADLETSPDR